MKASNLVVNQKWWQGPKFLEESNEFWPTILNFKNAKEPASEISDEIKALFKRRTSHVPNQMNPLSA